MNAENLRDDVFKQIEKHRSFWDKNSNEGVLIARLEYPAPRKKPYPMLDGRYADDPQIVDPDNIDFDKLIGVDIPPPRPFDADKLNCVHEMYPVAWLESIIGCGIFASSFSCSAKPVKGGLGYLCDNFFVKDALKSTWAKKAYYVMGQAVDRAAGKAPVSQIHLRGIVDMLAAYLGEERLCLSIFDDPDRIICLLEKFTEIFTEIADKGFEVRHEWRGGYGSCWGVYAPGKLIDYQIDASSLFSSDQYAEMFLPFDKAIINRYPYQVIHLHECGLHMTENVIGIKKLRCIEISLERECHKYNINDIIDFCHEIQKAQKSIILSGELTEKEVEILLKKLKSKRLAIFYWNPKV